MKRHRDVAYALLVVLAALIAAGVVYLWATSGPHEGSAGVADGGHGRAMHNGIKRP